MTPTMPTPNTAGSRPVAVPAGGPPTRRKWLLPLLLGLLLVIGLVLLLSQCGDDDSEESSGSSPRTTATTPQATASSAVPTTTPSEADGAGQTGAAGSLTAGDANLLEPEIAADLSAQNGRQAVGRAVRVQSVPADEGFWVGSGEQNRLWVQLTGTGDESNYKVKQGDSIDFTGTVTPAAQDFADKVGVTAAEGADQLTSQAHYVSVPASSVKLSD